MLDLLQFFGGLFYMSIHSPWSWAAGLGLFLFGFTWPTITNKGPGVPGTMADASQINNLQTEKVDRDGAIPFTGDVSAPSVNGANISEKHQVALIGDSITTHAIYGQTLQAALGSTWRVNGLGVSGQATPETILRFANEVTLAEDREYVVILLGVNDVNRGYTAASIEANLQAMYTAAHNVSIKVVAVTILPEKGYASWTAGKQVVLDAVNTWIKTTAINVNYIYDAYAAFEDPANPDYLLPAYDFGDGLHPSATGDAVLGNGVFAAATWTPRTTPVPTIEVGGNALVNQGVRTVDSPSHPNMTLSRLYASTVPYTGADKTFVSSLVTPTELGYLAGATSNLQAQLAALTTPPSNMIANSALGVWSYSDATKGIGSMAYDGGSGTAPVVGETMTGGTSGATGKVISYTITGGGFAGNNAAGVMILGVCAGRFNDNEAVTGGTGGGHVHANTPAGTPGADLVYGGECEAVTDWLGAGSGATPSVVAGGQVGNMMTVTNDGAAIGFVRQGIVTVVGKLYAFKAYFKKGTATGGRIKIGTSSGAATYYDSGVIVGAGWVAYTKTFRATTTATYISLYSHEAATNTALYDEISLYEITPGCTAASSVALDKWIKSTNLHIYRQDNDGGTFSHDGSYYALKMVPSAAGQALSFPGVPAAPEWYQRAAGRTVTFGAWVKTSTAAHALLYVESYDSVAHSGGGGWEWLEISHVVPANPTTFSVTIYANGGNVDGSTVIYISQPTLVFGGSIGSGNYAPIPDEVIYLDNMVVSAALSGRTGLSDIAATSVNLEEDTNACLPVGTKAVYVGIRTADSGSAGADCSITLDPGSTIWSVVGGPSGLANNGSARNYLWAQLSSGAFRYTIDATGANTFGITTFQYLAVRLR